MKLFRLLLPALLIGVAGLSAQEAAPAPPVILLKLDDVVDNGARPGPIPPRFQRVVDFLEQKGIDASLGIIGFSLEAENPAYFGWIQAVRERGHIEFWNHGYYHKRSDAEPREFEGSLASQIAALQKTEALAKAKLGFELHGFGPHWSGSNAATEHALDACPEITYWFALTPGARSLNPQRVALERMMALEDPTFIPDPDKFMATYEKVATGKRYLALQGHPNEWDDARWAGFVKIIAFLQAKGCAFKRPSDYLAQP